MPLGQTRFFFFSLSIAFVSSVDPMCREAMLNTGIHHWCCCSSRSKQIDVLRHFFSQPPHLPLNSMLLSHCVGKLLWYPRLSFLFIPSFSFLYFYLQLCFILPSKLCSPQHFFFHSFFMLSFNFIFFILSFTSFIPYFHLFFFSFTSLFQLLYFFLILCNDCFFFFFLISLILFLFNSSSPFFFSFSYMLS